ncbi:hypothetical protein GCM10010112_42820 [Actinoplanes lobatus]|uniref:Uncharacterized protein n=1 Tax=Actinoplanes lobatus TaxID=113568 RepID=A0ABQ4AFH4_9ACTN|nr:hypothetical protein GCM10010109_58290 [Actinoplanes campanulatus]GGN73484.1 hypothetical protein GCM10010112_42820 [Actinoplanes lobatus]GID38815.1 hypothetical protein Aca09nite_53210 [Actinoplanes campanulatus]GIE39761.1 hypothetical protein Alo02nite_26590 [Actinoplanes lobatus]
MITYHRLYFRCPACVGSGMRSTVASYWYHDCGGPLELGSNAAIRCTSCWEESHVSNWRYSCSNHSGDYRATNSALFASSMSMSAALVQAGGRRWLMSVLTNLADW